MQRRTNRIEILLTDEELSALRAKSADFGSLSCYIRSALREFSGTDAKKKMEAVETMAALSRKLSDELAWAGGNLNQAMKRANELSIAGLLTGKYYNDVVLPSINEIKKTLGDMQTKQSDALDKLIRDAMRIV